MNEEQVSAEIKTPGIVIAAFVTSLFGFMCGLPALVGLVLGIVGRKRAGNVGKGIGLANAAIVISASWLALILVISILAVGNSGSNDSAGSVETQTSTDSGKSTPNAPDPTTSVAKPSDGPSAVPTPSVATLDPKAAFLLQVQESAPTDARELIGKRKDATLLKAGLAACEQIQVRGATAGYGMFLGSQLVSQIEAPWVAQAAVERLCPELGVSGSQVAAFESNFDGWVTELASELPFSTMLDEAREQGGVGREDDDNNMMKNAFMFCAILSNPKPWEFFEAMDGMQPSGSTPSLLEYKGLINSAHFYICPEVRYSPQDVAKKWFDRNVG